MLFHCEPVFYILYSADPLNTAHEWYENITVMKFKKLKNKYLELEFQHV